VETKGLTPLDKFSVWPHHLYGNSFVFSTSMPYLDQTGASILSYCHTKMDQLEVFNISPWWTLIT